MLETGQCTCGDFFVNGFGSKCTATLELRRCEWAAYVMHTHKPACPTDGSMSRTDCSGWPPRSQEHQASQMACPITHRICTRMERAHDVPGTCTDQQCRLAVMFSGMYGSTHKELHWQDAHPSGSGAAAYFWAARGQVSDNQAIRCSAVIKRAGRIVKRAVAINQALAPVQRHASREPRNRPQKRQRQRMNRNENRSSFAARR